MFKKVLIANRGEIAVRIIRTCHEMGIETVAVYSEADSAGAHVLESDQAILIGPSEPAESYLNIEKVISAALQTGAEAVHPGYGFLAENSEFALRCGDEGITFIGPPSKVIKELGNKTIARRIMEKAGVPVIPGMLDATTDMERLSREASRIGYPVLIKAASGGGGKGMRIISDPGDIKEACVSAMSEAEKAFGDPSLYIEKCLSRPRHIEFQILADSKGNVVHMFERECSIQRRHQKIIEETPSMALTPELRDKMGKAAVSATKASGYINAGTVEFLLDSSGMFYFLEVNTRLQVEHPITEMTTGMDLVRQQLEIAAGGELGFEQKDITRRGHAIECRIYAEDPEDNFFPSPGPVLFHKEPSGPGIRNDCGIYGGFEVPVEYDPILSKLIVSAFTREDARHRMIRALENYAILGIRTTIPFLIDVLKSSDFKEGKTYTDFIEKNFSHWAPGAQEADLAGIAYITHGLSSSARRREKRQEGNGWQTPWETLGNWNL